MTKLEYVSSIANDPNTLEVIEDEKIRDVDENTGEYVLRYLKKNYRNNAELISYQYLVINGLAEPE